MGLCTHVEYGMRAHAKYTRYWDLLYNALQFWRSCGFRFQDLGAEVDCGPVNSYNHCVCNNRPLLAKQVPYPDTGSV